MLQEALEARAAAEQALEAARRDAAQLQAQRNQLQRCLLEAAPSSQAHASNSQPAAAQHVQLGIHVHESAGRLNHAAAPEQPIQVVLQLQDRTATASPAGQQAQQAAPAPPAAQDMEGLHDLQQQLEAARSRLAELEASGVAVSTRLQASCHHQGLHLLVQGPGRRDGMLCRKRSHAAR